VLSNGATNYIGDEGTLYGGDLGLNRVGNRDAAYDGLVVQQSNSVGQTGKIRHNVLCPPVVIAGFSPVTNCGGGVMVVTGSGFGAVEGTGVLRINGIIAVINTWSDTNINITIPAGATTGPIAVTNTCGLGQVTGSNVTIPVPVVTGFSPSTGCVGDTITITGSGFGTGAPGALVTNYLTNDVGARDGWVEGGGLVNTGNNETRVGDTGNINQIQRSILGVDVSSIPDTANITAATLYIQTFNQNTAAEVDPFQVDYLAAGAIDAADWGSAAILADFYNFPWAGSGQYGIPITVPLQDAITNAVVGDIFQVRILPQNPGGSGGADQMRIRTRENGTPSNWPRLVVYYTLPPVIPGAVSFNGIPATNYTSWSETNIQVQVPGGATSGPITVSNICGSFYTTTSNFTLCAPNIVIGKIINNIQLGGSGSAAYPGATITYRIFYTNNGTGPAQNLTIYDLIPSHETHN